MTDVPYAPAPLGIYGRATAVTTSDTLANAFSALYIGVTGDVTIVPAGQTTVVLFKGVPVGILPVSCSKVMQSGTTATNIVGFRST